MKLYQHNVLETRRQYIIECYGLQEMMSYDFNKIELYESIFGNKKDINKLKRDYNILRKAIPDLIYRLVKIGKKAVVDLVVSTAKKAIEHGRDNIEALRYTFYALLFFAIGYTGNSLKDKYNEQPIIQGTHIETTIVDGNDTIVVYADDDTTTVIMQPDKSKAPVVSVSKPKRELTSYNDESPIRLLKTNETKTRYYHASDDMLSALADVEHFVDHIYDTANRNRKITKRDMLNPKVDLTIGYGHKLTKEERQKWNINKKVTKADAYEMFKDDVAKQERIMNIKLSQLPYDDRVEYSQGMIDGLLSMQFNIGAGNLYGSNTKQPSEFWKRMCNCRIDRKHGCINKSDIEYSLAQINSQNVFMKGHKTRRRAEYFIAMQPFGKVNSELYNLKD